MVKTKVCKGDKVMVIRGDLRTKRDEKGQPLIGTVLQVDRDKGVVWLEMPKPKTKRGEKEKPLKGLEVWKSVRYNPQKGEAGGLKIIKRPIPVCNLKVVEKGPRRAPRA
jgi:ribosomal protein L24